ncbi:MAG: tetratricopeptide repeat protein [Leptospirales bacterium]|nr:tetratricopeptide repeat protein [Leptospirales bacterium]
MREFKSFPLKLAVIDALMEEGFLKGEIANLRKQFSETQVRQYYSNNPGKYQQPHPGVFKYFNDLDIAENLLLRVKSLSFEGGNEIYRIVTPEWDGEDEQFTVRDLSDLIHLPNLEILMDTTLLDIADAKILLQLANLSSVDVQYGSSIRDLETIAALEKKGVRIENKELPPSESVDSGPDPELRLSLDYSRAQELLWDDEDPAAALELLEKILAQNPGDADSWFEKGNALDSLGKSDAAATAWKYCLTLKPNYPEVNYGLANYYKDKGNLPEALVQINAALNNGLKSCPEAWHIRGQLGLALGQDTEAIADLKTALELYRMMKRTGRKTCFRSPA